jgi:hypothetical protein
MRPTAILLGSLYLVALIAVTPLAYAGTLWLGASERGMRTQVAGGSLVVGWFALAAGAVFVWKAVKVRRPNLMLALGSGLVALVAYAVAFAWGGHMLI